MNDPLCALYLKSNSHKQNPKSNTKQHLIHKDTIELNTRSHKHEIFLGADITDARLFQLFVVVEIIPFPQKKNLKNVKKGIISLE